MLRGGGRAQTSLAARITQSGDAVLAGKNNIRTALLAKGVDPSVLPVNPTFAQIIAALSSIQEYAVIFFGNVEGFNLSITPANIVKSAHDLSDIQIVFINTTGTQLSFVASVPDVEAGFFGTYTGNVTPTDYITLVDVEIPYLKGMDDGLSFPWIKMNVEGGGSASSWINNGFIRKEDGNKVFYYSNENSLDERGHQTKVDLNRYDFLTDTTTSVYQIKTVTPNASEYIFAYDLAYDKQNDSFIYTIATDSVARVLKFDFVTKTPRQLGSYSVNRVGPNTIVPVYAKENFRGWLTQDQTITLWSFIEMNLTTGAVTRNDYSEVSKPWVNEYTPNRAWFEPHKTNNKVMIGDLVYGCQFASGNSFQMFVDNFLGNGEPTRTNMGIIPAVNTAESYGAAAPWGVSGQLVGLNFITDEKGNMYCKGARSHNPFYAASQTSNTPMDSLKQGSSGTYVNSLEMNCLLTDVQPDGYCKNTYLPFLQGGSGGNTAIIFDGYLYILNDQIYTSTTTPKFFFYYIKCPMKYFNKHTIKWNVRQGDPKRSLR